MQSLYMLSVVSIVNCWMNQRCAIESQRMVPSPSLCVSQSPPHPDHSVLVFRAACTTRPVLLKTAYSWLTSSTYCVVPAAPSLSGGADPLAPIPRKFTVVDGMRGFALEPLVFGDDWLDVGAFGPRPLRWAEWAVPGVPTAWTVRMGGEVSKCALAVTSAWWALGDGCESTPAAAALNPPMDPPTAAPTPATAAAAVR